MFSSVFRIRLVKYYIFIILLILLLNVIILMRVNLDPTLSIKREHLKAHKNTHNDVYEERNSNRINKNYVNNARKVWRGKYANISNEIHREILYELDHLDPYFLIETRSEYIQNKYKNLVTQMKILHGSTKISPSDITELNAWLIHHGTDTTPTQPKTNQAHRYLNLIGRLSGFLCDSTVVYTDLMTKGTQLKFLLTLAHPSDGKNNHGKVKAITTTEKHTLRAVFKPKWYSNNITFPGVVDGKDRHYGEYIGFLLSLILELYTVPVTLLRSFPMSHFLATASPRLNTTYFPGPHNTSCYMGKCLYCTRDEALCAGKTVAGAVILYLENTPVEKLPSPYQRSYGGKTKAWERDEKYCLDNVAQRYDREFILDLVDVAVFDFLMQNGDRHHLEKTKEITSTIEVDAREERGGTSYAQIPRPSLLSALHFCFGREFYACGALKLISDLAGFAAPLLLYQLVNFIETGTEPFHYGVLYAGALTLTTIIGKYCEVLELISDLAGFAAPLLFNKNLTE
ncbi:uncharacterized protein LOC113465353 [Diaphorina citri]|uniref:Uncharacterized protein LOC113465353 n=1 Tax=Diaphorina citri TaxID=121845 RepID=A0A3Q0J5C6_DIACI|nr:uncharacterized protein LOC113465353 [Diaphorina citri]